MRLRGRIKKIIHEKIPGLSGFFFYCDTKVFFPKNSIIFHLACKQGIYELQNIQLIQSLIQPETIYMDVGANIGLLSLPILKACPRCKILSWEPSPNTVPFLRRTVENSRFRDRWTVIEKAAGSEIGDVEFSTASLELGAFDGFHDTHRAGKRSKIRVPVTTIDYEWQILGCPKVSVIKLDIEGAELQALYGAKECIRNQQPYILIEWNEKNLKAYSYENSAILTFANEIGYQVLSTPDLIPMANIGILNLYMMKTEYFLLVPV